jgi:hypothetical protein
VPDIELCRNLYAEVAPTIIAGPWHWFSYHFRHLPPHPFVKSLIEAAATCEEAVPGLGRMLLADLAAIAGHEKHLPHWDQLNQKLAEILVLGRVLSLPWPSGEPRFVHEPAGAPKGKRPELLVEDGTDPFVFEVKAPSLLQHSIDRGTNSTQFPGRVFDREFAEKLAGDEPVTLPRDNPVKDFLVSADAKFAPFKATRPGLRSVVVIVWDDFIYEPITSLVSEEAEGLLTARSFARTPDGAVLTYPNVDAVLLIRHLNYFIQAAREQPLGDREHAFDFGDYRCLPNVFIPVPGGNAVPDFLLEGLRAIPHDDAYLQNFAEYRPQELILWI